MRVTGYGATIVATLVMAAVVWAPPSSASTTSHRVLLYHAEETADKIAHDSTPFANDGSLHGIGRGPGQSGLAYVFGAHPAIPDYVKVPATHSINPFRVDYTYAASINIAADTAITRDFSIFRRGAAKRAGAFYKMEIVLNRVTGNLRLTCAFRDQSGVAASVSTGAAGLHDGMWHRLICGKTASEISLTVDGVTHTKAVALGNLTSDQPLYLGVEPVSGGFHEQFLGSMDEIAVRKG
jgi:concanavalin A-like lectin/glucanase superfamily protein